MTAVLFLIQNIMPKDGIQSILSFIVKAVVFVLAVAAFIEHSYGSTSKFLVGAAVFGIIIALISFPFRFESEKTSPYYVNLKYILFDNDFVGATIVFFVGGAYVCLLGLSILEIIFFYWKV